MSLNKTSYPTVATIIGCPDQFKSTNGLVATPLGASGELQPPAGPFIEDTSHIKDPIQKALIDNICGKLPTKNPPDNIKCEVCKVECNGNAAYRSHLSGAKHARRLKEAEMREMVKLPFIRLNSESNTYSCTLCNATLNAVSQIGAHVEGAKHKSKTQTSEPVTKRNAQINSDPAKPRVDATPNLLFCATCNIHVNSPQQLEQHTSSKKHINKVNGGGGRGGGGGGRGGGPMRNNTKQVGWRSKSRGGLLSGYYNRNYGPAGPANYPKITHNFVPANQFRPY